jgi:predicted ATPase
MRRFFSSLRQHYLSTISARGYKEDPRQAVVLDRMQQLLDELADTQPAWQAFSSTLQDHVDPKVAPLAGRASRVEFVRGLYLYGSPGCGKTFLMSLLYEKLGIPQKQWSHFNQFMMDLSNLMHKGTETKKDQILYLSNRLARTRVLFLDEFQVVHISDAMVLKRVFERALPKHVTLIASSNRPP